MSTSWVKVGVVDQWMGRPGFSRFKKRNVGDKAEIKDTQGSRWVSMMGCGEAEHCAIS